ncbi:MAG: Bax inhibitor-1/YccA family protein [Oceanicoccus sp.]|uniref:Bax inhibitor-1/YccA family protein n=1 Tax=Oceanicoccus sp. TaxID=2691044 RepID=UPI00261DD633|nr:Bax inhibitor-1/YccA family protein [Oceanicoccus sp.]MCP3908681.1 Bax inhibitor-1/YccA family protein [Oceanicoccus sp.]MDG1773236.1 Bax inhibitor-1/YccA family protein [Oceanicoccus sp.]
MRDNPVFSSQSGSADSALSTNKVLRNTYMMLAMTMMVSAITAGLSMWMNVGYGAGMIMMIAAIVLIWFVLPKAANSSSGIYVVFAFTALMGAALGPTLNRYLAMSNGGEIVMQALGGTALVFFSLSGYVLTTRKDFSFMGGFLMTGLVVLVMVALALMVGSMFGFHMPAASLALSAGIVLLMSGFILFDTSRIINGGETNYLMATVSLYLNIYNLFTSLLHILGVMSDD